MRSPLASLALAVLAPLTFAQSGSGTLTVRLEWESGTLPSAGWGRVPLRSEPVPGVTYPAGLVEAHYARIVMADTRGLALALDATEAAPRLWVDRDFDGDLAEERAIRLPAPSSPRALTHVVLARYEGEPQPEPLPLEFVYSSSDGSPYLRTRAGVHRLGTAVLGGRLRSIALVDDNYDLRFDDRERDRICVDLDGDGEFQLAGEDPPELVRAGEAFRVGDEGWTIRVTSSSGRLVELERAATLPPARPRPWQQATRLAPGRTRTPPAESLEDLLGRFDRERTRPYAERYRTVAAIGDVGTKASFDALERIAGSDPDASIRLAALRVLGNPACLSECGDRIARMAREATPQTAAALAQALYDMGHPERDEIYVALVRSSEPVLVQAAARWLAWSDSEAARGALLKAALEHSSPQARYGAYVQGVRNLPGGPPVEVVLQAARDDYAMLRAHAIRDLALLGRPEAIELALAAAEERPVDMSMGTALCAVLGAAGSPTGVRAMLGLLEDQNLHDTVRKEVVEQLRFIRAPDSVAVIVAALGSKHASERAVAAEVLAAIPERPVTEALLERSKREKDDAVLVVLLEALGDHGDPLALPVLTKHAKNRRNEALRTAAVRGMARLGFHIPEVRRFFLAMLESRSWEDRVLALDAAAAAGDPSLLSKVLRSIDHDVWQVGLATVEALDALRVRGAVEPLIERLGAEEEQRIRDATARALFRLTGMNLLDNEQVWKLWWSENRETFSVPAEIPTMPDRVADSTQAGFYGIPVTTERVVFVIDQSGSMSADDQSAGRYEDEKLNRLEVAIRETLGALGKLPDSSRVNVVLFHSTIHPWQDELQRLGPTRRTLQNHLESQRPQGGTNIYDALERALRMEDVDTIFLLSDGVPGLGKFVTTPDILRAVRRENQIRRIMIHCVAIGTESELLRELAAQTGGRYVRR